MGRQPRRIGHMKRTEHGLLGRFLCSTVALGDHELRESERIRQQDELLALPMARLTGAGEEFYSFEPFLLGELDLARERMQVPN